MKFLTSLFRILSSSSKQLSVLGGSLLLAALLLHTYDDQPLIGALSSGYSSAFHNREFLDPLGPIEQFDTVELENGSLLFQTSAPARPRLASLTFRYQCEPQCPELWLSLKTQKNELSGDFLLAHPVLEDIDWFFIRDQGLTLYQREISYQNISNLLSDGQSLRIFSDPSMLPSLFEYGVDAKSISGADSLATADYVITTYAEPTYTQPMRIFSRNITVLPEFSNEMDAIEWEIWQANPDDSSVIVQQPVEYGYVD